MHWKLTRCRIIAVEIKGLYVSPQLRMAKKKKKRKTHYENHNWNFTSHAHTKNSSLILLEEGRKNVQLLDVLLYLYIFSYWPSPSLSRFSAQLFEASSTPTEFIVYHADLSLAIKWFAWLKCRAIGTYFKAERWELKRAVLMAVTYQKSKIF